MRKRLEMGIEKGETVNKDLGGEKKKKMKTKTKMIAFVEIAIVLCSVFLVAIPAIAADQTMQKVSASGVTAASAIYEPGPLDIYGNANEDDTIDMGDVVYVKLAIFGKKPKTELCDAKYDGRINVLDVIQTKLIILGKEKEITIIDGNGEPITVPKPVERIVVLYMDTAELLRVLNAGDKIVGVSGSIKRWTVHFPELSELPSVGGFGAWSIDYEAVLNLNPDVLLTFGEPTAAMQEKLPGVAVIFLGLYRPNLSNPERSKYTAGVRKMEYILDKEEEAEKFLKWRIGWINEIKSRTEGLSEDEKPRVFNYVSPYTPGVYQTYSKLYKASQMNHIAGGKNIADDLPEFIQSAKVTITVDPEWVIDQNPDFIVAQVVLEKVAHGYAVDDPSEMAALRDDIMSRIQLANVNAVKTENVYIMSGNYRNDASGYFIGAAYMAKWFHPDLFEDMDPLAIHQEYLTRFQHFDYNVYEHGVWVWPPLE